MDVDASNTTLISNLQKVDSVEVSHYCNIVQSRPVPAIEAFKPNKQPYIQLEAIHPPSLWGGFGRLAGLSSILGVFWQVGRSVDGFDSPRILSA